MLGKTKCGTKEEPGPGSRRQSDNSSYREIQQAKKKNSERDIHLLHIMCGYQCDKAVNKNDTCEVI